MWNASTCMALLFSEVLLLDWQHGRHIWSQKGGHSFILLMNATYLLKNHWALKPFDPASRCYQHEATKPLLPSAAVWGVMLSEQCWGLGLVAARFRSCCSQLDGGECLSLRCGCGRVVQGSLVYSWFWWNTVWLSFLQNCTISLLLTRSPSINSWLPCSFYELCELYTVMKKRAWET